MPKYPQVERFFAEWLGDEHGVVGAEARRQLVESTGKSEATVSRWMMGENRPGSPSWAAIADVAGCSVTVVKDAFRSAGRDGPEDGSALHRRVEALALDLDRLTQRVVEMGGELERLRRAGGRGAR